MARIPGKSFISSIPGACTFHPGYTFPAEPANIQTNQSPLLLDHCPDFTLSNSLHHAPIPLSFPIPESNFRPDSPETLLLPSHPDPTPEELAAHYSAHVPSLAIKELPFGISSTDPSALPYTSAAPLMTPQPRSLLEPTNVALGPMNTFNQTQAPTTIAPSMPATFHGFGGDAAIPPSPNISLAPASPVPSQSNTPYTCQCVTSSGLSCSVAVSGTTQAVRRHLKQCHAFRTVGKDRVTCLWPGCEIVLQRDSIPRHIVTRHFRARVRCVACGVALSRRDVQYPHAKVCRARRQTVSQLDANVASVGHVSSIR